MDVWQAARRIGASIIREIPGGDLLVDTVNQFLPRDKKLGAKSTGDDLASAVDQLSPEHRVELMQQQFELDITAHQTVQTMLVSDATSKHTTRPRIAWGAFVILAFVSILVVSMWAAGVATSNDVMVNTISDGWPFVLTIVGPFVTLLYAYFGVLRSERKDVLNAFTGTRNRHDSYPPVD